MSSFSQLLQLLQLTRSQTQYGYLLSGVPKEKLSDLAQHHYLVTFIGWQMALHCQFAGANINTMQVLEICLVHDLGELFGGDINWFYAKHNPAARKAAKVFEEENNQFLLQYFGEQRTHIQAVIDAAHLCQTDEARLAKLADYLECLQYKNFVNALSATDLDMAVPALYRLIQLMSCPKIQKSLTNLINDWLKTLDQMPNFLFFLAKS
ncbi:MAG: HD domain-containing protein [Candidatus Abawacabacteria bacterium]|nr:HD domain-containing protein [Candidatus Abawacabacteria bacterium]